MIILSVAIDAPTHLELRDGHEISNMAIGNEMKLVDLFHRTVTGLALNARLDVAVVAELDVLGEAMELNPFDGLLLFPMQLEISDALDLIVIGGELRMATHADLNGGNTCGLGNIRSRVTIKAVDFELTGVMLVAEGDRLDRPLGLGIPCIDRRLTGAGRGPLFIELDGNFDLEMGIVFLGQPQSVRVTDAGRDPNVAAGRSRRIRFTVVRCGPSRPEDGNRGDQSGGQANHE